MKLLIEIIASVWLGIAAHNVIDAAIMNHEASRDERRAEQRSNEIDWEYMALAEKSSKIGGRRM